MPASPSACGLPAPWPRGSMERHGPGLTTEERMRTLIKGGTIVNADATTSADVLVDGERIALIGADLQVEADRTVDASGKWVIPGAIDVHTHMELPFGGDGGRATPSRRARARRRSAGRRRSSTSRSRGKGQSLREARRVARQGRGQRLRRLRLPHDHERRHRRHPGRDGHPRRRGRDRFQAVHRLSGRLLQR